MPFKKSSDESDDNTRQVHLSSSVVSIHTKKRHHPINSEEIITSNFKHSLISKSRRERLYNEELDKQYRNSQRTTKLEIYHQSYKDEDDYNYKRKRTRLSIELEEKDIKKCDRPTHKNKDQSNKRETHKHKKTRDHKDKPKRDKYQSKSKKDHKRRKSINEDELDTKCANESFDYNNDYINNDSDVNEDTLHNNFSSIEPPAIQEITDNQIHSISPTIEKELNGFLDSEMKFNEENRSFEENNHNPISKQLSDDGLENFENYELENYGNYPTRSKFESLTTDESDIDDLRNNDHSYDRDSRSLSSGSSSSESFGSSISSSRNPKKNKKKSKSREPSNYRLDEDKLIFSPIKDQESEEELDCRPLYHPAVQGCRLVEEFECLNKIEEGTYGVVFRARDRKTNEIVALKRLKMEKERDGFPITSLREINTLMKAQHENIVTVREVVVGSNMDKIYLVMDFIEHDLKSLMISMVKPFEICEVKCLMLQLLSAVAHLHDNWILHRDLKTSNLLLSHKGVLKVADFGLAREYGSPLKNYTRVVVTLWYRAPELLLGTKVYSTQIDLWSVGCIFGELLLMAPLFPGKSEADQINILFKELGTPSEKIWPGVSNLPNIKRFEFGKFEYNRLSKKFNMTLSESGLELINKFLAYCPDRRITAEEALNHSYFNESPKAISSEMFPTRPAKSEGGVFLRTRLIASPKPPSGGQGVSKLNDDRILGLENFYNRRG